MRKLEKIDNLVTLTKSMKEDLD